MTVFIRVAPLHRTTTRGFPPSDSTASAAESHRGRCEVLAQGLVRCRGTIALGVHDEIKMAGNIGAGSAKDFPEQTLYPVPCYRTADLARNRESQSMIAQIVGLCEKHEFPRIEPPAFVIEGLEVRAFDNSLSPGKLFVRLPNHSRSASSGPWHGVCSKPGGRPWLPSWPETHGFSCACCYLAGTSSS
jgi:hypothetical protein